MDKKRFSQTLALGLLGAFLLLALTIQHASITDRSSVRAVLVQPSEDVKRHEELDEDHQILEDEKQHEGIYKPWNAAHNDEVRGDNIGMEHPSSAWHHDLFSKAKPIKKVRRHAKVIKSIKDPDNMVKFYPLRWMQKQDEPAVKTRMNQGLALTQKLFIVPQANVLTGTGQEKKSSSGAENVGAEKEAQAAAAAKIVAAAAAQHAAADFEETAAVEASSRGQRAVRRSAAVKRSAASAKKAIVQWPPLPFSAKRAAPPRQGKVWPPLPSTAKKGEQPRRGKAAAWPHLPKMAEKARKATHAAKARQQALWNAATESAESKYFKSRPKPTFGVPLKGAYRGYHASKQRSYLPPDFHAPGAYRARTQELWDAAENDSSLESTREKLGMSPPAPHPHTCGRNLEMLPGSLATTLQA